MSGMQPPVSALATLVLLALSGLALAAAKVSSIFKQNLVRAA